MDRQRARGVTLAVLATVAVALTAVAAAPVFSQQQGADAPGNPENPTAPGNVSPEEGVEFPVTFIVLAVVVVGVLGLVVQFARDPWETFKASAKLVVLGVVLVGVLSFLYERFELEYFVAEGEREVAGSNLTMTPTPTPGPGGFGEGTSDPLAFPVQDALLVALVAGAFGVVTVLAWRSGAVQSALGLDTDESDADSETGLDAVGQVAGEAADRVEEATTASAADDAIYGAWRDMVGLLGVDDPQAETPRQFARAATEAGMDPDDVSVLTGAFEEVRYGDVTLSTERRERVTDAFRRIEATHDDSSRGTDGETGDSSRGTDGETGDPGEASR
jgi:hypothetical protein